MKKTFHSNGKLLLTAEFLVIDGAKALALPTRFGQKLTVEAIPEREIRWKSFSHDNKLWFEGSFTIYKGNIMGNIPSRSAVNKDTTQRLEQIFGVLMEMRPTLFQSGGFSMEAYLEFPRDWGLGSSSTLIANLAEWAGVNPFILSDRTFGGSAYDIACAKSDSPLVFQRSGSLAPTVREVRFDPPFKKNLFFVHLNQKQDTREVVSVYKKRHPSAKIEWVAEASKLTDGFLACKDLTTFEDLMQRHETLLAEVLAMPKVSLSLFPDYPGTVKSLGAWGGDFILATGGAPEKAYFRDKGYSTVLDFKKMAK